MFDIQTLIRKNIRELVPYSSARDEYKGEEAVFLDANENPFNNPLNRYPDPQQLKLKRKISEVKNVPVQNIFLGNGSDEAIDLLIRAFCEPSQDNIISIKPTYGMYKVSSDINHVEFREVMLNAQYQPDVNALLSAADKKSKILFLCSPNNPTSNSLKRDHIIQLIQSFPGIVVVDEAYIDFSSEPSLSARLGEFPNLVLLQTFSKAWGMAGIRLGLAYASREIIEVFNKIKYPYNINILTQKIAIESLTDTTQKDKWIRDILHERQFLNKELSKFPMVKHILPSDANFLMVKFDNPQEIFNYLICKKVIVRDRSKVALCEGFLRITVGSPDENRLLLELLKQY